MLNNYEELLRFKSFYKTQYNSSDFKPLKVNEVSSESQNDVNNITSQNTTMGNSEIKYFAHIGMLATKYFDFGKDTDIDNRENMSSLDSSISNVNEAETQLSTEGEQSAFGITPIAMVTPN